GGAIVSLFCAYNRFNPAKGVAENRNALRSHETLLPQPYEPGKLIVEMVGLQQVNHFRGSSRHPALSIGGSYFIHNVRSRSGTQPLSSPVGRKECPPTLRKDWPERLHRLGGIGIAAVVEYDRRKGTRTGRLKQ